MNRKLKQFCLRMAVVVMMIVAVPFQSFAANARIAFSDHPSVEVGSEISVTMKFTSTSGDVLGNTDVMLAYDASMLEYVGGSENVNGGSGALRVTSGMEGKTEIASTLKFKALQAGSTQITISSWEGYDADGQMLTMDRQGSSAITVTAPATYSSDAALQSLQISPGTLDPAFSPEVENYTASVSLDTARLTVSAVPNSSSATVAVEGGTELQDGVNTVVCRVTAEDGTTVRNYTITVNRVEGGESAAAGGESEGETTPVNLEVLAELEASRTPLKIGITALPDGVTAPSGLKESSITIGDTKVTGWIPQTEEQAEYCVLYGVSENGVQGFYRYDITDRTLQRYFEDNAAAVDPELVDVAQKYNDLVDDYALAKWIAIAAMGFAVVLLIVLIVTLTMASRRKQDNGGEYETKPETQKKPAKPSRGKKLTREERYMMGEEDDFEPEAEVEEDYLPEEYLPEEDVSDASVMLQAPVDSVEQTLAEKLAREATAAAAAARMPEESYEDEDDDFEVFDLDEDK